MMGKNYYVQKLADATGCTVKALRGEGACGSGNSMNDGSDPSDTKVDPGKFSASPPGEPNNLVQVPTYGDDAWFPFFPSQTK